MNRYKYSLLLLLVHVCVQCASAFKLLAMCSTMAIERHVCMPFQPTRSCVHEARIGFFHRSHSMLQLYKIASHKRISSELQLTTRVVLCCVFDCTTLNIPLHTHTPLQHTSLRLLHRHSSLYAASLFAPSFDTLSSIHSLRFGSLLSCSFPSLFWYVCMLLCFLYFSGFIDTVLLATRV